MRPGLGSRLDPAASTRRGPIQLAMWVAGGPLLVGALVNLVGLERRRAAVAGGAEPAGPPGDHRASPVDAA